MHEVSKYFFPLPPYQPSWVDKVHIDATSFCENAKFSPQERKQPQSVYMCAKFQRCSKLNYPFTETCSESCTWFVSTSRNLSVLLRFLSCNAHSIPAPGDLHRSKQHFPIGLHNVTCSCESWLRL